MKSTPGVGVVFFDDLARRGRGMDWAGLRIRARDVYGAGGMTALVVYLSGVVFLPSSPRRMRRDGCMA